MTEVAFFGGSFDPPHFGHVLAAAYARGRGFERIVVAPVLSHAFGKRLEAFEHRLEMARLAFLGNGETEVSEIEAELPVPSFTLNTLNALKLRHPDWRLRLLIGSDVLADLSKWNRFDEILELAPPFVLSRPGAELDGEAGLVLPAVSSTDVRNALVRRRVDDQAAGWLSTRVPASVLSYIEERALYLS